MPRLAQNVWCALLALCLSTTPAYLQPKFTNDTVFLGALLQRIPHVNDAVNVFREIATTLSVARATKSSQCLTDMDLVYQKVLEGQIWALKMIDSSTKIPFGLMSGNIVDLGVYDECVNIGTAAAPADIQAQYCLAAINLFLNGTEYTSDVFGDGLTITFALCLPSSCTHEEIQDGLEGLSVILRQYMPPGDNITLTVNEADCHTRENLPLNAGDWYAIIILLLIFSITISSTTYEYFNASEPMHGKSVKEKLLTSFSILSNGRKLFSTSTSQENLPILNFLKVVSIFWVVTAHKYRYTAESPIINLLDLPEAIKQLQLMLILNAPLSVDVFFLISALLVTYNYLKIGSSRRLGASSHVVNIVYRYIRLTPAYALMILFTTTILYRMGDGPLWDRTVGLSKDTCQDTWWAGLLYVNNYYFPDNYCMMQSWYLSADMQLFLFAPILLYPLLKWPRWGLVMVAIGVGFSVAIPFYVAYIYEIKAPIAVTKDMVRLRRETNAFYLPTHTKIVSYVIGILVGYILFQIKIRRAEFKLKKRTAYIIWTLATILLVASLFGGYPLFQTYTPYNRILSSTYLSVFRLGWSLGIAWVIIACSTGHGGWLTGLASVGIFGPLGRLTYCVYLVHIAVILKGVGSIRSAQYCSHYELLTSCIGIYVMSLFFAVILSLTTESPLVVLEKLVFRSEPAERTNIELPRRISPSQLNSTTRKFRQQLGY